LSSGRIPARRPALVLPEAFGEEPVDSYVREQESQKRIGAKNVRIELDSEQIQVGCEISQQSAHKSATLLVRQVTKPMFGCVLAVARLAIAENLRQK